MEAARDRKNGDTLVAACQRVGRVDVSITGGAERGSVCLTQEGSWGTLAGLTDPHALMARGQVVCCMHAHVAPGAQVRRVRTAVDRACSRAARVTNACPRGHRNCSVGGGGGGGNNNSLLQHLWRE